MNYRQYYVFEWDPAKSERCFRERGFDFEYANNVFFDPCKIIEPDLRYHFGENRFTLTGKTEGRLYVVIFTERKGANRIISAHKANYGELTHYENRADGH